MEPAKQNPSKVRRKNCPMRNGHREPRPFRATAWKKTAYRDFEGGFSSRTLRADAIDGCRQGKPTKRDRHEGRFPLRSARGVVDNTARRASAPLPNHGGAHGPRGGCRQLKKLS